MKSHTTFRPLKFRVTSHRAREFFLPEWVGGGGGGGAETERAKPADIGGDSSGEHNVMSI